MPRPETIDSFKKFKELPSAPEIEPSLMSTRTCKIGLHRELHHRWVAGSGPLVSGAVHLDELRYHDDEP